MSATSEDFPRQYKRADLPRGQRGTVVVEFTEDGREEFLHLPEHTRAEFSFDIVQAIQRAYRAGWEDRATSDRNALDRIAGVLRETDWGDPACADFSGSITEGSGS